MHLQYAGPSAIRRSSRLAPRRFELVNRHRSGAFVYVAAAVRPAAHPPAAQYRLALTTGAVPAARR